MFDWLYSLQPLPKVENHENANFMWASVQLQNGPLDSVREKNLVIICHVEYSLQTTSQVINPVGCNVSNLSLAYF